MVFDNPYLRKFLGLGGVIRRFIFSSKTSRDYISIHKLHMSIFTLVYIFIIYTHLLTCLLALDAYFAVWVMVTDSPKTHSFLSRLPALMRVHHFNGFHVAYLD